MSEINGQIGNDSYTDFATYTDIKRKIASWRIRRDTGWFPVIEGAK